MRTPRKQPPPGQAPLVPPVTKHPLTPHTKKYAAHREQVAHGVDAVPHVKPAGPVSGDCPVLEQLRGGAGGRNGICLLMERLMEREKQGVI